MGSPLRPTRVQLILERLGDGLVPVRHVDDVLDFLGERSEELAHILVGHDPAGDRFVVHLPKRLVPGD